MGAINPRFLFSIGWRGTKYCGVRSSQSTSIATLQKIDPSINRLSIALKFLTAPTKPKQKVYLLVISKPLRTIKLIDLRPHTILIPLPDPLIRCKPLEIQFRASNVITPKEAGISAHDIRPMGIGLMTIQLQ